MKIAVGIALLAAFAAFADGDRVPGARLQPEFVMVLSPGSDAEPELARYGATMERRWGNRVFLHVSEEQARELSKHPRVRYLQRILKPGELSGYVPPRVLQERIGGLVPDAVTNPAWNSGDYKYDGVGNIIGIGGDYYSYDQVGRIGRASLTGTSAYDQYIYDSFGNLVERGTSLGGGWSVQSIPANGWDNRLSNATYDGVGNMKNAGGGNPYGYNYDPFKMALEQYAPGRQDYIVYDAKDERIGIRSADQTWKWTIRDPEGSVVRQYETPPWSGSWMWVEDFVKAAGAMAGSEREAAEGGRRHFHADHLGTTRMVTNHAGQAISRHDFSPYGVEITSIRQELDRGYNWPTSMVFTGHERDFLGGLWTQNSDYIDYMHARYYRAAQGRFSTVDPEPESVVLTMAQSWNRYSYVLNNPVNITDPTGLRPCRYKLTGDDAKTAGVPSGTVVDGECVDADAPKTIVEKVTFLEPVLEPAGNFTTGFADTVTLNGTKKLREHMGDDQVVNPCSDWYTGGQIAGVVWWGAVGGAAGGSRAGGSMAAREFGNLTLTNSQYAARGLAGLSDAQKFAAMGGVRGGVIQALKNAATPAWWGALLKTTATTTPTPAGWGGLAGVGAGGAAVATSNAKDDC